VYFYSRHGTEKAPGLERFVCNIRANFVVDNILRSQQDSLPLIEDHKECIDLQSLPAVTVGSGQSLAQDVTLCQQLRTRCLLQKRDGTCGIPAKFLPNRHSGTPWHPHTGYDPNLKSVLEPHWASIEAATSAAG